MTDAESGAVLMVAHMNREALQATIDSGEAVFWSRSRGELWRKGATSGNTMRVRDMHGRAQIAVERLHLRECERIVERRKVRPWKALCNVNEDRRRFGEDALWRR